MDLRDKYCDVEIIGILVKAVNQGLLDCNKKSASDLRPNLLKLMGRLTSQVTNNSEVWKLYSDLCWKEKSQEDREKALHFLVKAHRTRTQSSGWENDISQFKEVIALTLHLSDVYTQVSKGKEDKRESVQLLSSAKLILKQLIARAKKLHTDAVSGHVHPELSQHVVDLETSLQRTAELLSSLKN
ncbi:tetratricopeptide repeat protein 27-like [Montipora capricornis]|uniref:tetratricopeptide repeat protein 27-like n=1 Tax=Montipora capricornis TaxID=246305 RepID=UPI0035F1EA19